MFTGIIQVLGSIKGIERKGDVAQITIDHNGALSSLGLGDSVAVDGVCLTVVDSSASFFKADISQETLQLTILGDCKRGQKVNLEKSLTPSTPLGGHFVTGHIDGVGFISKKTVESDFAIMDFNIPKELQGQVVKKGSIAVDGISLTVTEILDNGFRVAIIPRTLKNTTLSFKKEGDKVNIETDIIAKYVERYLMAHKRQGMSEAFLKEHGFIRD